MLEWLQASVYFLPHVLFRLGYYSIALLALVALLAFLLALPILLPLKWKEDKSYDNRAVILLALVLTLLRIFSFLPPLSDEEHDYLDHLLPPDRPHPDPNLAHHR